MHHDPDDYEDERDRFTQDERITANLRLRSISPGGRFLLGALAFIPPPWRGPIALVAIAVAGFLAAHMIPELVSWIRTK